MEKNEIGIILYFWVDNVTSYVMKTAALTLITLLPLLSLAQKREWKISYENNINKLELTNIEFGDDTEGFENLPEYFDKFEGPYTFSYQTYTNDSLGYENLQTSYKPYYTIYFRNTYIGIGTSIFSSDYIDINHAAGLNLSLADYRLGTIRSFTRAETLEYDSVNISSTEARYSKSISAYKKIKRIALSYENTVTLKPVKWLNMSIGARHQLHFKFTDRLLTGFSEYSDTVTVYPNYFLGVDDEVRYLFGDINLYDRQYPSSLAHKSARDLKLQYDLTLFLRPEFIIGKQKKTSFYFNLGYTPLHFYGNDFVPRENPFWYGVGLSRKL